MQGYLSFRTGSLRYLKGKLIQLCRVLVISYLEHYVQFWMPVFRKCNVDLESNGALIHNYMINLLGINGETNYMNWACILGI